MTTQPLPVLPVPIRLPHANRILVPIDFSNATASALNRAIDIAKIYHSSLWLVHVMSHPTSEGMATILPGALLEIEADLRADLDKLQTLVAKQGIPCTTLLRKGSVLEHVKGILHDESIDLLVLATHGGRGIHGMFLGSTAERLIRSITIPVLTVGFACHLPHWDEKGARHILFAGDFCPETLCGLSLALGIQQTTGARLSVIRAVPRATCPEAVRAIRNNIESLVPPGTDIHISEGPVGKTVCRIARELSVGLVALGVHKNSFAREVFGTGLVEILLNAPCPVLSVRQCDQ
ncbi:MAG TPA: universal stress protein [Acidobacteriaceae bacterium]